MRGKSELGRRFPLRAAAAAVALLGGSSAALAVAIDTGNDDFQIRLDTQISATEGWRVTGRDEAIAANPALGAATSSEYFADKGDLYTTRFDCSASSTSSTRRTPVSA